LESNRRAKRRPATAPETAEEETTMLTGRVVGTATATVRHPSMQGWKLLVVQSYGPDGRTPDGDPVLAVDALGAGAGDLVMVSSDGKATRQLVHCDTTPVRWSVIGIIDR
jgi:microcompartment protein CcmK/EutM